ncbi:TPA: hypothetical protein DD449_04170 [Candidatus Berkelbacteria bacterium]|uniref:Uncharacterized protein n=1 Tax=Berkelbacteria bacterium GW2011_GWE1_39_12 TaxID=1618337 RepID=A0A0G4B3Y6_9BACT|nr:MAG: hypothetical protein UT28_C0001G0455 [Berkelbacteria bacterium GW2011_GWE1_39_12]HBO60851.1 hypothetical protein [Candidatus Berkelbacteria bacterium]
MFCWLRKIGCFFFAPRIDESDTNKTFQIELVDRDTHKSRHFRRWRKNPFYLKQLRDSGLLKTVYIRTCPYEDDDRIMQLIDVFCVHKFLAHTEENPDKLGLLFTNRWPVVQDITLGKLEIDNEDEIERVICSITEIPIENKSDYPSCQMFIFDDKSAKSG